MSPPGNSKSSTKKTDKPERPITLARWGKGKKAKAANDQQDQTWIHLVDIETCSECGGDVCIIACIEDPLVISKILTYLDDNAATVETARLPQCRAPPATGLFD